MNLLKKKPTRRQTALCRLLLCVLILLALMGLHMVSLTPTQTLRGAEHRTGVDRTEILAQTKDDSTIYTFSAHETLLLVTAFSPPIQFSALGGPTPTGFLPLSPTEKAFWFRAFWLQGDDSGPYHLQFFGRVDLPAAASVRVYCGDLDPDCYLQADLFPGPDGHRYLWADRYAPETHPNFHPYRLSILDQTGQVLRQDIPFETH